MGAEYPGRRPRRPLSWAIIVLPLPGRRTKPAGGEQDAGPNDVERGQRRVSKSNVVDAFLVIGQLRRLRMPLNKAITYAVYCTLFLEAFGMWLGASVFDVDYRLFAISLAPGWIPIVC